MDTRRVRASDVTSPPYWNLKEYAAGNRNQMGHFEDYEHFLLLNNPVFTAYGCVPALVYRLWGAQSQQAANSILAGYIKGCTETYLSRTARRLQLSRLVPPMLVAENRGFPYRRALSPAVGPARWDP
jgi:hypothetical protein